MKKILYLIIILCSLSNFSFPQGKDQKLLPVKINGKWGFIDLKGKIIITPQFDYADNFSEELAAVRIGDLNGYVDGKGNLVIKPQFKTAWGFHEGLATVYTDSLCGCIDKKGKMVIPPKYGRIEYFEDGIAFTYKKKSTLEGCYIDKTGKFISDLESSLIKSNGMIKVKDRGYGFIDFTGKIVIQPQFSYAENFNEDLAIVKTSDPWWGCIDKTGKYVIESKPEYFFKSEFSEGMIGVRINKKWGFMDKTGNIKITPQYDEVDDFHDGLAKIEKDGEFGYIDKSGNVMKWLGAVLYAGWFENGIAAIHTIDKKQRTKRECWMLIDKSGNQIGKNMFYKSINGFFDGIAVVENEDGKKGYIDQTGNLVTELIFDSAERSRDGIAKVRIDSKWGYIDKSGKYIWAPTE